VLFLELIPTANIIFYKIEKWHTELFHSTVNCLNKYRNGAMVSAPVKMNRLTAKRRPWRISNIYEGGYKKALDSN